MAQDLEKSHKRSALSEKAMTTGEVVHKRTRQKRGPAFSFWQDALFAHTLSVVAARALPRTGAEERECSDGAKNSGRL